MSDEQTKMLDEVLEKQITNEDKIDQSVENELSQMGFLWKTTLEKFEHDKICFECNQKLSKNKMYLTPASSPEGAVAFASLCKDCYDKYVIRIEEDSPDLLEKSDDKE